MPTTTDTSVRTSCSPMTRRQTLSVLAAAAASTAAPSWAQAYPSRPIKFVVGFPAGGSVDIVGRIVSDAFASRLKATTMVDNQGGAAGAIAAQRVVTSAADGYSLLVGSSNELVATRILNPSQRYDARKDMAAIGMIATSPVIIAVSPRLGVKSLPELLALLRRNPGKLSYGSSGVGSSLHFAGELFKQRSGVFMTHIPYRGVAPLVGDLVGGSLDIAVLSPTAALPFVQAGRVLALGVTSAQRLASLPDVPALGELPELKGYELVGWFALTAPRNLPSDVQRTLNTTLQEVLADPVVRKRLQEQGMVPATGKEDLAQFMNQETAKYENLADFAQMRS